MTRTIVTAAMAIAVGIGTVQMAGAQSSGGSQSMKSLLQQGFEIKAAAPSGNSFVVFMQKDQAAYACEFVTVTNSRCGAINQEAE